NSLEVENGTFIENDLSELRSDLLFSIKTISGNPLNIYILFEHKSYRDSKIFTQLLSYIAAIHKSQTVLMPVIPLVFYHDKQKWDLGSLSASKVDASK
ncbi:MAG: Rpn family recombination-promoting nuclease/putative transposase, partial [Leptonema sp. (in: Bacteria)]|nr:Rpn family recombination-promoting nuclease/putative transposase [Leptonema sp. (in: bacteria)]